MGHWYLVRHGETDWNLNERIQGQTDTPLNATGRRQADLLGRRLDDVHFDAMYSSDLARTYETAQLVAKGRDLAIVADPDLREFSFGEWEGLTDAEIEARQPGALTERISAGNEAFSAPGGENTWQVLERVRRFCTRTAAAPRPVGRHPRGRPRRIDSRPRGVLAGPARIPTSGAFGSTAPAWASSAITPTVVVLVRWNDISHLPAADRDTPV